MPQPNRCEICGEPTTQWIDMCPDCHRSWCLHAEDTDRMTMMLWAARRARWYAERRAARNARAAAERQARVRG